MPVDLNLQLAALGTVTATTTHTGVNSRTGTPRRGLRCRILVTGTPGGTSPTSTFKIHTAPDSSGSAGTYVDSSVCESNPITASGEYFIEINSNNPWWRLVNTVTGTAPSFVYQADVQDSMP